MKYTLIIVAVGVAAFYFVNKSTAPAAPGTSATSGALSGAESTGASALGSWLTDEFSNASSTNSSISNGDGGDDSWG